MPPKAEPVAGDKKPKPKLATESAPPRTKPRPSQPTRAPPSRPTSSVRLRGSTITIDKPRNLAQNSLTIVVQTPKTPRGAAAHSPRSTNRTVARGPSKSPSRALERTPATEARSPTRTRVNLDAKPKVSSAARAVTTPRVAKSPVAKARVDSSLRKDPKPSVVKSSVKESPKSGIVKESKVASAFEFWAAASKAGVGDYNPLAASRQKTEFECGACGNVHDQRTAQCSACGEDLEFQCWTCGVIWKKYIKFCSDCGSLMLPPLESKSKVQPSPDPPLSALALPAPSVSSMDSSSSSKLTSSHSLAAFPANMFTGPSPESSPSLLPISSPLHSQTSSQYVDISAPVLLIAPTVPVTTTTTPSTVTSQPTVLSTAASTTAVDAAKSAALEDTLKPVVSENEEDDFGADTEFESRQRRQTEAPIVAAAQRLADGKAEEDKDEEEGQLSLDLSQYSSIDEMVEAMLLSKHLAISFRNIFFNTLHLFSTPSYILEQSIRVLSGPPPEAEGEAWTQFVEWSSSKLKGYSVLKNWLSQFPQDFDDNMKSRVLEWLSDGLPASWRPPSLAEGAYSEAMNGELIKLSDARSRCLAEARLAFAELLWIRKSIPVADPFTRFFTSLSCWPDLTKHLKDVVRKPLTLVDKKPKDVAAQLTLLQIKRMLMVPGPRAFLKGGSKLLGAPSQMKISNSMSCWVACEVLKHNSRKDQALVLNHFVQIAKECYALRNFATVFEIVYGLNQNSVYRLRGDKATGGIFDKLSRQTRAHYDSLIQFANPSNNYGAYRKVIQETLREGQVECWAPYLGVLLKDLITIEEGGKPLKLKVRVEESNGKDEEDEDEDDPEVLVEISGGPSEEEEKSKEVVYVLFDKCREMSQSVSRVLACCHNYPIFPIAGAGGLLAAPGQEIEGDRQTNLLGVNSKERRKAVSYDKLVPDEVIQLQLLEAILSAMTVEELDARSLEILPRRPKS